MSSKSDAAGEVEDAPERVCIHALKLVSQEVLRNVRNPMRPVFR